ncbi:MAG: DUF5687 family protein [Bacteroidales bacterium]|jgi:hypothetical protein|nr:DUF5687 family protein [Bacteroidales bacterium]HOI32541.1 DUF5687 family protein [Bacteroidales bacterium]
MLAFQFIIHQMKQARRSSIWQKSLVLNILLIFVAFILLAEAIGLSLLLAFSWHEIVKESEVLTSFYQLAAWYFVGSFVIRFFMQQLPALEIRHYQNLPIKKSTLIHFLLIKGKFNFFSLISLILFTPFAFKQVGYYEGTTAAWIWLAGMLFFDLTINYLVIWLKKLMVTNLKTVSLTLGLIGLLALGEYLGWYSYSDLFATMIDALMQNKILWFIPLFTFLLAYGINYRFLKQRLYLEEISKAKTDTAFGSRFGYLQRYGIIGEVMLLDIKLFLRNKRTKSILFLTPVFLAYGLIFYPNETYSRDGGFMIFIGIFISGFLMLSYLQYAFAYEGNYWDFLISSRIPMRQYIRAKFFVATVVVIVAWFLTLPYLYFGKSILMINTATALFNLGILIPMALFFATYNKKAMMLSKGSAFNYQGTSTVHWLVMLPAFVLPIVIYMPFKWFGQPETGILVLGGFGLLALAFRPAFVKLIQRNLSVRKYIMAEGFREKN